MEPSATELTIRTSAIVAAFVGANRVACEDLPALIGIVHKALASAGKPDGAESDVPTKPTTAQIRRSVRRDGLISFENGRSYKTLKRHLATLGMTTEDYKAKWGLPGNYPTTSPDYSAMRSAMAKAVGLGKHEKQRAPRVTSKPSAAPTTTPKAAGAAASTRGQPKKSVAT